MKKQSEGERIHYFRSAADLRGWFARHHASKREAWIGYYKKGSGKESITWPESVDEALCVGWIDGVRKSIDGERYKIRFSPRRQGSVWSAINIRRVAALSGEGRMQPAGLTAFAARKERRSGIYSYEQRRDRLEEPYQGMMKKNKKAWTFFAAQPPGYRKKAGWWIVSAKREATRSERLKKLIELSARGCRLE